LTTQGPWRALPEGRAIASGNDLPSTVVQRSFRRLLKTSPLQDPGPEWAAKAQYQGTSRLPDGEADRRVEIAVGARK
jgi:hypothetical protein